LITVAGRLGEVGNASKQAALGADTLGRGFAALKPLIGQGEEALREMVNQATVASDEAVAAADAYGDSVAKMQGVVKVFIAEALAPLLPLLTRTVEEFTNTGTAAVNAADGIDKTTSKARQLGIALADTLQSAQAFHQMMQGISGLVVEAGKDFRPFRWPWEDEKRDPNAAAKALDNVTNAWSRMTNHFNAVTATVDTTAKLAKATRDLGTETEETANKAAAAARKAAQTEAEREAKRAAAAAARDVERANREAAQYLAQQEAALERQMMDQLSRETALLNEKTLAQMRANGATQDEIDLARLKMQGASDIELQLTREIQAIDNATEASAENKRKLEQQSEQYTQTIVGGFNDIFHSITEGGDSAAEAVKRLVAELVALFITQQAMKALGFNSGGTWGFQGVAKGGAFDQNGMMPFAQGGIVHRATPFVFGGGRLGVMGEAGPEAIMPLGRDAQGRLGVRGGGGVTVNVHNNANANVGVQQEGNDISIIIDQVRGVIANDFARGGNVVTTAFEGAYGVRR
jgi:hypothetical protein